MTGKMNLRFIIILRTRLSCFKTASDVVLVKSKTLNVRYAYSAGASWTETRAHPIDVGGCYV